MTLDHHSPPAALPFRYAPVTVSAANSFLSFHRDVPYSHPKRPLFSHTYKPLLPEPFYFVIDTNCRVPTPAPQPDLDNAPISHPIYKKQTEREKTRPFKNVLELQKSGLVLSHILPATRPLSIWIYRCVR